MTFIFAVFTGALISIGIKNRLSAIFLILLGLALTLTMFWHHATSVLHINL